MPNQTNQNPDTVVRAKTKSPVSVEFNSDCVNLAEIGAETVLKSIRELLCNTFDAPFDTVAFTIDPETRELQFKRSHAYGEWVECPMAVTPAFADKLAGMQTTHDTLVDCMYGNGNLRDLPVKVNYKDKIQLLAEIGLHTLEKLNNEVLTKLYGNFGKNPRVRNGYVVSDVTCKSKDWWNTEEVRPVPYNSHVHDTWAIANYYSLKAASDAFLLAELYE